MPNNVQGTFSTGQAASVGQISDSVEVPSGFTTMHLTLTGLDGSNTVKTQKRTTPGGAWADDTTYNSDQAATAVTVAHGEEWRLVSVTQQAIRDIQFKIRVDEHLTVLKDLTETAIRDAGYSMQTLSGTGDVAMTATEVASRERRSLLTRGRKVQYNSPVLRDMLEALLAIDAVKFGPDGVQPATVKLEWPKWVFVDPMDTASTVQLLRDAQVVSQETALRMLHPDWDDEEIQKERARLVLEQSGSVVDLSVPVDAPDLMDDQMDAADAVDVLT